MCTHPGNRSRMISTAYIVVVCFALAMLTVGAPNGKFLHLKADFKNMEEGLLSNHTLVSWKGESNTLNIARLIGLKTTPKISDSPKNQLSFTNSVNKSGSNTNASKAEASKIEGFITEAKKVEGSTRVGSKDAPPIPENVIAYKFDLQEINVARNKTAKFYSSGLLVKTGAIGKPTPQDVVLVRVRGVKYYDYDTNATAVVNYPASFKYKGIKVTYVFVISKQTSNKLDVVVTKGEIAKTTDNLQVTLKTGPTKLFIYQVTFYSSVTPSQPETMITYNFGDFSPYLKEIDVSENKPDTPGTESEDATYFNADVKYSGAVNVTFVRIFVKQRGDVGSAVVTEGAIGTTSITIHLQANKTNSLTYTAKFYSSGLVVKTAAIGKSTPNDIILARVQGTQQYGIDTNVSVVVKYPGNIQHKSKKITYVFVTSNQTSDNKLEVAVTKGELAKATDNLEVTLKANATKLLSYEVVFYSSGTRSQPLIFTVAVALIVLLWNRVAKI